MDSTADRKGGLFQLSRGRLQFFLVSSSLLAVIIYMGLVAIYFRYPCNDFASCTNPIGPQWLPVIWVATAAVHLVVFRLLKEHSTGTT
jgi:hypothetical protein